VLVTADSVDGVTVFSLGCSVTSDISSLALPSEVRFRDDITRGSEALVLSARPLTPPGTASPTCSGVSSMDAVIGPSLSRSITPNCLSRWIRLNLNALSNPASWRESEFIGIAS
jgi:hypothetical protein